MDLPKRKHLRDARFSYAGFGSYFITICTHEKARLFGEPGRLTPLGTAALDELLRLPSRFKYLSIRHYVVMPNHVHFIATLADPDVLGEAEYPGIPNIVGAYKAAVTRRAGLLALNPRIWQKSYYDRVLRNEEEIYKAAEYIAGNPGAAVGDGWLEGGL